LKSALETQKRHQSAASSVDNDINAEKELASNTKCETPAIAEDAIAEISKCVDSEVDIMLKIVSVYGDDIELARQYYLAAEKCVSPEMFESIYQTLKDEGITF
jgi:hypothetical protein